ncbi:hypothetical protein TELCIR_16488 [Teladorsagia circumcincta]|uniref:Uncharacterized protein n=1 Tax=Teladorsagia circumcincta TaxID=45464 RepID=A0A2G9TWZ3_TELCI|nr:hypothetical protein TELCIR_16488 [Teladorsagia circumcincta]
MTFRLLCVRSTEHIPGHSTKFGGLVWEIRGVGITEELAICSTQSGSAHDPATPRNTNTDVTDDTLKGKANQQEGEDLHARIARIRNTSKLSNKTVPPLKVEKTQNSTDEGAYRQDKTQIASKEPIIEPGKGKAADGCLYDTKQSKINLGKTQSVHDGNREKKQSLSTTDECLVDIDRSRTPCSEVCRHFEK